jgi:hypothetical protein
MIIEKQEVIDLLNEAIDNIEAIDGETNRNSRRAVEKIERVRDEWITLKDGKNIEIEFDNETFKKIAELSHEDDITFNQKVAQLLEKYIDENPNELIKEDLTNEEQELFHLLGSPVINVEISVKQIKDIIIRAEADSIYLTEHYNCCNLQKYIYNQLKLIYAKKTWSLILSKYIINNDDFDINNEHMYNSACEEENMLFEILRDEK